MKRLALVLGAFGVIAFGAFSSSPAHAQQRSYPPGPSPALVADPDVSPPNGVFDAVLTDCFPGETVTFYNFRPFQTAQDVCDDTTYTASVQFTASGTTGTRYITAYIPALNSSDPDVPSLPPRFLVASYTVQTTVVIIPTPGAGGGGAGAAIISTSGSGDAWPSFLSSAAFYRTFLGLLALMAGSFFVWLWRRRREDEQQSRSYGGSAIPPPDPSTPSLA